MYERAVGNVPPALEKRFWQRYIYLWMNYALWEELGAEDPQRTRAVYQAVLGLIPHQLFTFAKVICLSFQVARQACHRSRGGSLDEVQASLTLPQHDLQQRLHAATLQVPTLCCLNELIVDGFAQLLLKGPTGMMGNEVSSVQTTSCAISS